MNNATPMNKVKFISKSLLWAALLYGCAHVVLHVSDFNDKKIEPISYSQTSSKQIVPINISVDSLHKKISITGKILNYLMQQVSY